MKDSEEVRKLKGQLAERDALLREIEKRHWSGVDFDLPHDLVVRIKALSASAEPSAPLWYRGDVVHSSTNHGKYWECMEGGTPGVWEEKDSTERPFLPSATEPSVPVGDGIHDDTEAVRNAMERKP